MGVCKQCGAEIPDGRELCSACQQKELEQSEAYLDELLGAMKENADDISGLQLSPKLGTDALSTQWKEEAAPEHSTEEAEANVKPEQTAAEEINLDTLTADLEDEIDLDALLAQAEQTINTDTLEEEPDIPEEEPIELPEEEPIAMPEEEPIELPEEEPIAVPEEEPIEIPEEESMDISALLAEAKEGMDVDALLAEAEEELEEASPQEEEEIDLDALLAEAESQMNLDAVETDAEETPAPDAPIEKAEPKQGIDDNIAEEDGSMEEKEFETDSVPVDNSGEEDVNAMLDQMLEDLDNSGNLQTDTNEPEAGVSDDDLNQLLNSYTGSEEETQDLDGLLSMLEEEGDDSEAPLALDALGEQEDLSEEAGIEDSIEALAPEEEEYIAVPELEKPKKKGFFAKIFGNIITDEIAEKERAAAEKEQQALVKKEEEKEKQKAADEEKKAKKAEADAEKKAEKAKLREEKKLAKAAKKAEKAAKKAEEEAAEAAVEIQGQLNKVGVSIVAVLAVAFLLFVIFGTRTFSYSTTIKEAKRYFSIQKYTKAYNEILGVDVKKKDKNLYDKIITVMHVNREIDSYNLYTSMKKYPEALDALIKGLKNYDSNIETAKELEVETDMEYCKSQIISSLQENYGLSEEEARQIMAAANQEQYSKSIVDTVLRER